MQRSLFLFATASSRCREVGALIDGALAAGWQVYGIATPNVATVIDPALLFERPDVTWVRDYEHEPLDRFPFGQMLVAPCTFNTFNKLAHGIADTLATSMIADALGAGCPITIAPSMNYGLWHHPQTAQSYQRLRSWGCTIVEPQQIGKQVIMATIPDILSALERPQP